MNARGAHVFDERLSAPQAEPYFNLINKKPE
jgi:hypothetical protein